MKKYSLTLVLLILFIGSIYGQFQTGFNSYNEDRNEKHLPPIESYSEYFHSGHFISSVAENMESEFLQMGLFVALTVFLYQVGSSESKKRPEEKSQREILEDAREREYTEQKRQAYPILWRLYENSLTLALLLLFAIFFLLHAYGSVLLINEQKILLREPPMTYWEVFSESEFWFESFQNWQSEFFSIIVLGLLSICLRQYNSAQSKKMNDSMWKTGDQ